METFESVNVYFSTSANRGSHSIALSDRLLLIAASNSVILYDYQKYKFVGKLDGHQASVTSVKWIVPDYSLVTGSADKSVKIWTRDDTNDPFQLKHDLQGHSKSVLFAVSYWDQVNHRFITLSSGSNRTIRIWSDSTCLTDQTNNFYVFDGKIVARSASNLSNILLIMAGSDSKVHLQKLNSNNRLESICILEGHQEWIRSVDCIWLKDGSLMVASGCQDNFIRIWKIDASNLFDEHSFDCTSFVSLETVIVGHEDKIYCVKWIKSCSNKENEILQLLSTSIDRSAIVWEQPDDVNSNVWLEKHRFGEISGNNLGFLSGEVSPNGVHLIINSYNGALHAWKRDEFERWQRDVVIGGHSGEINGLAWSPDGSYLISGASDCSTRIHCEWARTGTWHEVTRAQVHGYEVNCLAPLSSTLFASGADEKVIRVFQATKYFLQCYHNVSGQSLKVNASEETDLPDFATIPLLGLSNKAVFDSKDSADATNATRPFIQEPPTEEALLQHTCWSEHAKLYGHGYELFALASSHDGKLLASACKATNHTDASICLWNRARNFDLIEHLAFHRLTVTKLTFSPDDSLLLSVSRDRSWQLFRIETDASDQVSIRSVTEQDLKSRMLHSRVIRDACWMPDNLHFITVSRDQSAIVWRIDEKNESIDSEKSPSCMVKDLEHRFKADHAINCCDISKHWTRDGKHLIALGLESGDLLLTCFDFDDGWCIMRRFDRLHTLAIKQVRFSPTNPHKVATGGADAYVQIISIK